MIRTLPMDILPTSEQKLPKYLLYVDYASKSTIQTIRLESKDIISAMTEAESVSKKTAEEIYLLKIFQLDHRKKDKGWYKAVLVHRCYYGNNYDWHLADTEHGESHHTMDGLSAEHIGMYVNE